MYKLPPRIVSRTGQWIVAISALMLAVRIHLLTPHWMLYHPVAIEIYIDLAHCWVGGLFFGWYIARDVGKSGDFSNDIGMGFYSGSLAYADAFRDFANHLWNVAWFLTIFEVVAAFAQKWLYGVML